MAPAISPTPTLNREQPVAQARRRSRVISWLIGGAIGVAADFVGLRSGFIEWLPVWLIGFLVALSVGVLLHELGHLTAGRLAGFDFLKIVAGPWMVARESGGYRFRFLPKRIVTCAGQTVMIPRSTADLRRRFALFAAGGPVVTALLFLPVALLPWGLATSCLLAANLVLALFSWLPMTLGGSHTDGKLLRTLAGKGPASERLAAVLYLMAIDNCAVEPRQWPPEILARLAAETPGRGGREFRGEAAIMLLIHACDVGETEAMAAALEQVLAHAHRLRPDLRRGFFAEAAFFQGVYRRKAAPALAWLADARQVKGGVPEKDWDASALGAVAAAQEKWDEARQHFGRAIARLGRQAGQRGSVAAARRRLAVLVDSLPVRDNAGAKGVAS